MHGRLYPEYSTRTELKRLLSGRLRVAWRKVWVTGRATANEDGCFASRMSEIHKCSVTTRDAKKWNAKRDARGAPLQLSRISKVNQRMRYAVIAAFPLSFPRS
jgi:hypothetical protein